jgi:hypothetical protein
MRDDFGSALSIRREELHAPHSSGFRVGGVSVGVIGDCESDVMFGSQLQPFQVCSDDFDIDIRVTWTDELRPKPGRQLFNSGSTWRLYEDASGFRFDIGPAIENQPYKRLLVDSQFCVATLQMNAKFFANLPVPPDPWEYPLDELLIMHRLTQEKAIELHGCGIVRANGTGNLFVGHSGAGKSTTTRLWTALEDVEVLSDDRIIVRRDEELDIETPRRAAGADGEHGVLRLRDCSASRSNHFAQDDRAITGMRMYGTPWHGEAMYASPGSAPLARIFILEHGHGNVLTRLSPSQAVAELFARSFVPFHRHEYVDSALDFLQELVGAVPCYHYAFEPTEAAVEKIREFRD